jgi:uncharacterized membrane protein YidH (DUF202 family)
MGIRPVLIILVMVLCMSGSSLFGQDAPPDSTNNPPATEQNDTVFQEVPESTERVALPLSRLEFQLSLVILAFGVLLILLEIYLVRSKSISSEDTIKFIIITIIIVSTLFLITAGYSNDQIAPAVGLLGTIAGYLLGRINPPNKSDNEKI